jgi:hypothetical protein
LLVHCKGGTVAMHKIRQKLRHLWETVQWSVQHCSKHRQYVQISNDRRTSGRISGDRNRILMERRDKWLYWILNIGWWWIADIHSTLL